MNIKQNKLEVLKAGADDSLNLLDPMSMDGIEGGFYCEGFNYCETNSKCKQKLSCTVYCPDDVTRGTPEPGEGTGGGTIIELPDFPTPPPLPKDPTEEPTDEPTDEP